MNLCFAIQSQRNIPDCSRLSNNWVVAFTLMYVLHFIRGLNEILFCDEEQNASFCHKVLRHHGNEFRFSSF